jgi:hypothetical protein
MRYLIYLTLLASTSLNAGSIQKWTDADGNVFYGDTPPVSTKTEGVRVQSAPSNPGKALPRLSPQGSGEAAGNDSPASGSDDNLTVAQSKVACDNAQQDLEVIQTSSRIKLKLTDGTTRFLSPEEIDQRKARAEADIKNFCQ